MFILLLPFIGPVSNTETTMEWRSVFYENIMLKTLLLKKADPVKEKSLNNRNVDFQDYQPTDVSLERSEMTGSAPDSNIVRNQDTPAYGYPKDDEMTAEDEHSFIFLLKKVTKYVTKPKDDRIVDELLKWLIDA